MRAALQELKVRELDVSYCNLPTEVITSLLTRATTLEVNSSIPILDCCWVRKRMSGMSVLHVHGQALLACALMLVIGLLWHHCLHG
jgi:hypothetical protein